MGIGVGAGAKFSFKPPSEQPAVGKLRLGNRFYRRPQRAVHNPNEIEARGQGIGLDAGDGLGQNTNGGGLAGLRGMAGFGFGPHMQRYRKSRSPSRGTLRFSGTPSSEP